MRPVARPYHSFGASRATRHRVGVAGQADFAAPTPVKLCDDIRSASHGGAPACQGGATPMRV